MEKNFLELLRLLSDYKVKYLLIGGYAVGIHAEPRYTKDLDLWIEASKPNAKRMLKVLQDFGAPIDNLTSLDLATPGLIYIFGLPPQRIDILNRIEGADFRQCYQRALLVKQAKTTINVISLEDLMVLKKLAGRPQDKADISKLKKFKKR